MRVLADQPVRRDERGFTLVEILVAITILLVGVLGVTTLVSVSSKHTVANNSRQGATNVARRVLETSRALPFRNLKNATIAADIQAQSPDLASTSGGSWQVQRDGYTYTLDASVCRVDDDSDGYGAHDTADPPFCTDSTSTGTADDQAGDYKRVTVNVSWTANSVNRTAKQVTLVPAGGSGEAPTVTSVRATNPSQTVGQPLVVTTRPTPSQIVFSATTTNTPTTMQWLVDNTVNKSCPPTITGCSGSGNSWSFTWTIGSPTVDNTSGSVNQGKCVTPTSSWVFDGTYQVGAQPLDSNGLAGTAASTTVTINRCAPIQPPNFNATGRDKQTDVIDIEWDDNPEGDLVGYKVYRGTSTSNGVPICPPNANDPPTADMHACVDTAPPTYNKNNALYYGVYGYDQDASGVVRQGALAYVEVNIAQNKAPKAPTNLGASASGGNVVVSWTNPASPFDPDTGDTIESYRVYRRPVGTVGAWTYLDRLPDGYDSMTLFCNGSVSPGAACSFTDDTTGGTQHEYMVTSVDSHLRESVYITNPGPIA